MRSAGVGGRQGLISEEREMRSGRVDRALWVLGTERCGGTGVERRVAGRGRGSPE